MSDTARLIGDPARAAMLDALMSGEALTSGELARAARVSAATASGHLSRLLAGGLVEVVAAGRHRYYRLASPEVGHVLEALSLVGTDRPVITSLRAARADEAMRLARTCYDHLAGRLGVAVHDALIERGGLSAGGDGYLLTPSGEALLCGLGVATGAARALRRQFARPCLDFTQRRPHLAGALGAALCARLIELGWLARRASGQRALKITDTGRVGFVEVLKVDL
ncbi:MAG TPA: winged helix-turn-helix domain-containing protein [Jiangellales bacterium]|nr:winged helix-turn-helix domain-containing protein [Jiangellales bacterium]